MMYSHNWQIMGTFVAILTIVLVLEWINANELKQLMLLKYNFSS